MGTGTFLIKEEQLSLCKSSGYRVRKIRNFCHIKISDYAKACEEKTV